MASQSPPPRGRPQSRSISPPQGELPIRGSSRSRSPARRSPSPPYSRRRDYSPRPERAERLPPPRPSNAPSVEPNKVVGVFGLSIRTTERDLHDEFSKVAPVDKAVVVFDQRSQRSRGFGFVTMQTVEGAGDAIAKLNGMLLHDRRLRVDFSATTKAHEPTPGEYRGIPRQEGPRRYGGGGGGGSYRPPPSRYDDRDRWGPRDRDRDHRDHRDHRDRYFDPYRDGESHRSSRYGGPADSSSDWRRPAPPRRSRSRSPQRSYRRRSRSRSPRRDTGDRSRRRSRSPGSDY